MTHEIRYDNRGRPVFGDHAKSDFQGIIAVRRIDGMHDIPCVRCGAPVPPTDDVRSAAAWGLCEPCMEKEDIS